MTDTEGWFRHVRLSEQAHRARHSALRLILWLQLPLLAVVAAFIGSSDPAMAGMPGMGHSVLTGRTVLTVMIVVLVACAFGSLVVRSRRLGAAVVSLGLLLSAALLVSLGGGRTDLHFSFFLMVGLISLYQDWIPLLMSVVLVTVHHLVMGTLAPDQLYSDPGAAALPVRLAALHAFFVLGICAVQVAYWHFVSRAQQEIEEVRAAGERELRRTAERFEALVQDSSDVTMVVGRDGRIVTGSSAVLRVLGYPESELTGTGYHGLIHPGDAGLLDVAVAGGTGERRAEVRVRHADGTWRWHDVSMRDLCDHPAVGGWVVNHRDVTERRTFQEQLEHEASHDALTGLANRAALLRALAQNLAAADRSGSRTAVLYLDLDGFKRVNDSHGHEAGDALLAAVAAGLRRAVPGPGVAGRLGGDEFAVVLPQLAADEDAVAVVRRILAEVGRPVPAGGRELTPRVSVGVAITGPAGPGTDELLHRADTAMYHAKRDGDAGWRLWTDSMHDPAGALEEDLRHAVARGELRLHFQPIVALDTGAVLGVEALVRWAHPRLGLLLPEAFIGPAEECGAIGEIEHWVLREACEQVLRRRPAGGRLGLSVNVSPRRIEGGTAVADVLTVLRRTGFDPRDLTLEVSESAVVDAGRLTGQLAALQTAGIRIALDDFGTGYSSLRHLARLPVDVLKLDQCFVAELNGRPDGSAVAEAVIRLARILNLDTVAEGVERAAQATELTLLGCHAGQGFHWAHPLTADELDAFLTSRAATVAPPF